MNLVERLAESAARVPDRPALLHGEQVVTYAALLGRVRAVARALAELGLAPGREDEPGDRVALLLGNTPEFVEAFHAVAHAGLVAVPLNTGFTAEELAHVLADSGARAVIASPAVLPVVEQVREGLPALEIVLVAGEGDVPPGARRLEEAVGERPGAPAAADGRAEPADVADDALAVLQYTSGATGAPKGAMLSHGNLLANQQQMAETRLRIGDDDVVLCVLPLFHIYGLNVAMAYPLACGAGLLLVDRFEAGATLRAVARHRVTFLIGVPSMYAAWLEAPELAEVDLGGVRAAISGAAPLPPALLERWQAEVGVPLWEGYGLTETAPLLATVAMGDDVRPGSVGCPVPGVEVRLVDEAGRPVRRGDPGEIVVRGPNVFAGYWQQPGTTAEVLDPDGWFRTGDIAYAVDGQLHLVDRKKDLVIVNGFNVYPKEVEDVLQRHPAVRDAAVVGVRSAATGEAVRAFVVLHEGRDAGERELLDFCAGSLARFKCPSGVQVVDALPQLPSGKVLRRRLRESVEG